MNMMDVEKENFLKEFGDDYGYPEAPKSVDEIRATEFKRLDGLVYLDHAGATLYSEKQMESIFQDFSTNIYGNPHSQSDSSSSTAELVRAARQQVLEYCNASPEDYKCIFTSGATAALKLVGESFPWSEDSCFMYTMENHNSVLGIREYALNQGGVAVAVDIEEAEHRNGETRNDVSNIKVSQRPVQRRIVSGDKFLGVASEECIDNSYNLFAFPSECNFSGVKFSLDLVRIIKEDSERVLGGSTYSRGRWMVLIDAAKGCATQPPDLARFPADFVVLSFYKIFGYPTGLGALIVRNEAAEILRKTYFSGGTVAASMADVDFVKRREAIEDSFEDGTQSFLSITSIHHGFRIINTLTISAIERHTSSLSMYVRKKLLALRHDNGAVVCILYGDTAKISSHELGPTIAFNLKRPDSSWFGYREVEKLASLSGIQLRTGCFCNPGACAKYLGLSKLELLSNIEAGHVCWDDYDILNERPIGAIRISFGYMSTFEDAKKFLSFLQDSFVSVQKSAGTGDLLRPNHPISLSGEGVYLKSITIYPIKSCSGFSADSWPLSSTGLQYDREWLLKSPCGEILTQKKVPELGLIKVSIDLADGILSVESPRCKTKLRISLQPAFSSGVYEEVELHSQMYEVQSYNGEVNRWFTNAIARPCTLLRCFPSKPRCCMNEMGKMDTCRDVESKLTFVNEAQFLLVSEESISDLNRRLISNAQKGNLANPIHVEPTRFRPNLIIAGAEPYAEDNWQSLKIGKKCFTSLGGCNRCKMINLDPQTGEVQKSREPLATLASFRRVKGKIFFGILLRYDYADIGLTDDGNTQLQVGERVYPHTR